MDTPCEATIPVGPPESATLSLRCDLRSDGHSVHRETYVGTWRDTDTFVDVEIVSDTFTGRTMETALVTHYSHTHPRAAIEHVCFDCGRTIRVGEQYRRSAALDGATAWTWKECAHCEVLALHVVDAYDLDEYDTDNLRDYDPRDDGERAVMEGFEARWTFPDGTLYPAPVREHVGDVTYADGAFTRPVYGPIRLGAQIGVRHVG